MTEITFGILTVSDSCYSGVKRDLSGPELRKEVSNTFPNARIEQGLIPDDRQRIEDVLKKWSDDQYDVILTTGGTGFSERDVTPEATKSVIQKEAHGLVCAMISQALKITDLAMLSRAVCGINKKTLIINLPGSAKGAVENFGIIKNSLLHAIALLRSDQSLVEKVHKNLKTFQSIKSNVKVNDVASRPRTSEYPMLEVDDACKRIFKECTPTIEVETVPFEVSINRILAEDIYAKEPFPPFRASMKDGYAVRTVDRERTKFVRKITTAGEQPSQITLNRNEVVHISTGAAVPSSADAVVQVEDTYVIEKSADGSAESTIGINVTPMPGKDIREIGSDVEKGSLLLRRCDRISAAHMGILATFGITEVKVFKKTVVGILSTGNEIKNPRDTPQPGQIRDSNKFCLLNLIRKYGFTANDCGLARDIPDEIKQKLDKAFSENDVVISTGGVSMGECDLVKRVLIEDFSALIHFGRVNMKPGKPTTFATLNYKGATKIFFGLPGNPVSCNVTAILFVIPTLRFLERYEDCQFPVLKIEMLAELPNSDSRPEYHRVKVYSKNGVLVGRSTGDQISSRLLSMIDANGLALVKPNPVAQPQHSQPRQLKSGYFGAPQNKTLFNPQNTPTTQNEPTFLASYDTIIFDEIFAYAQE